MAREATFNFIPSSQLGNHKDEGLICSFNITSQQLQFSTKCPETNDLINKYIRFYVDEQKKTLAWRFLEEKSLGELKDYFQIKEVIYKNIRKVSVRLSKVLVEALKLNVNQKYLKMEVKRYKPQGYLVDEEYHYITFK